LLSDSEDTPPPVKKAKVDSPKKVVLEKAEEKKVAPPAIEADIVLSDTE